MYETIKRFYNMGIYKKEQLTTFTQAGWITQAQLEEMTAPIPEKSK